MSGEFDDLFVPQRDGNQSWYDKLGDEAKEWVDSLARRAVERNQLPNIAITNEAFVRKFPKETTCTDDTLSKHMKRLVARFANDDG